jgi:hypothetical protein
MSDAALGNTNGPAALIGQVELNGGTLQAGASFALRNATCSSAAAAPSTSTDSPPAWGHLTDVQRTLTIEILNSNTTTGAVA